MYYSKTIIFILLFIFLNNKDEENFLNYVQDSKTKDLFYYFFNYKDEENNLLKVGDKKCVNGTWYVHAKI